MSVILDGLDAERRSLERPVDEVHLLSDLALSAERAVELSDKPLVLQSELALRVIEAQLPRLQLRSPLAKTAQESVEELEELHDVLAEHGIAALREAIKQQELRKLHRVLMDEGLPGLRAAMRAQASQTKKNTGPVKARGRDRRDRRAVRR